MKRMPPDPVYIFRKNMAQINCLLLINDGAMEQIFAGTAYGTVHVWDLKTKREVNIVKVGDQSCLTIVQSNDKIITQERGSCIKFWRIDNLNWFLLNTVNFEYHGFCKISTWTNQVFIPCDNSVVNILQGNDEITLNLNDGTNRGEIMCLKYLENMGNLLVAHECGNLSLWDLNNCKIICEIKIDDTPMCFGYSMETKEGVLGSSSDSLKKFTLEKNLIKFTQSTRLTNPGVACIAINVDGKLCVTGCWDGRIRYFSMKHLTLLAVLDHSVDSSIQDVIFSANSFSSCAAGILFAAGSDGKISMWNLFTNNQKSVNCS